MELHTRIKGELKDALKAKDDAKLRTVRSMLTAFTNELVATGKKPQDILDDDGVLAVIRRLAKQRKESIVQFEAAGRNELAEPEKEELAILESYLPQMMGREDIKIIAETKAQELGGIDKSKVGMFIGLLMKELKGRADGADVKAVVDEMLK